MRKCCDALGRWYLKHPTTAWYLSVLVIAMTATGERTAFIELLIMTFINFGLFSVLTYGRKG